MDRIKEYVKPIQSEPICNSYGPDLKNLYGVALRKSLGLLCRECLWALLAVSIYYGLCRLFLW
jgi:hypothetical protein